MKAGEIITAADVRSVRPGYGAPPKMIEKIIGRRVIKDVKVNTPVLIELIEISE